MKTETTKPSKELEDEIMEFIFSKRCEDHRAALEVWNNNPWIAVSMYELEHHPENIGLQVCFPGEVEVPKWFLRKLQHEESLALQGEPIIIAYPRATETEIEFQGKDMGYIDKWGRLHVPNIFDDGEE